MICSDVQIMLRLRIFVSYVILDIVSFISAIQQTFFNKLIDELENAGVDVSAYKENPPNFNTINISGSGNIVGAVAQGASSRATARCS